MSPDNFWVPEDIQLSWSKLISVLIGRSNCQVDLMIIVKNGIITHVADVEVRNIQPRNRENIKSSQSIWNPVRQLQSVGCNVQKTAAISMSIVFDGSNNPLLWTTPQVRKLGYLNP